MLATPLARLTIVALSLCLAAPAAQAQTQAGDPKADSLAESVRELWRPIRRNVLAAAEQAPDSLYAWRPAADVRTFGQLIGHVANTHYNFCSSALVERGPARPNHETLTDKAALVASLRTSMEYCDRAYDALTTASAIEVIPMFGTRRPRLFPLSFNIAHDNEHYGNIVTYLRLNGIVPPSSQRR